MKKCVILMSFAIGFLSQSAEPAGKVDFNRDVRPLLSDNCFACHGPDKALRKSGLRLDDAEEPFKPSKSGAIAIVRGKPEQSELFKRLVTKEAEDLMPPAESHKKLSAAQIDLLKRWIEQGAEFQLHWSYVPPVKAKIADGKKAIDELVEKRLSTLGLKFSPEVDRRTLARRLHFDLIGLPPKSEDVEAFVKDTSADAYEKLVDKLLASPHYGERMAIGWLDVVRFADTIGYHSDNPRNVYPYRDWVIDSLNKNKRFDQFTLEQIAGDLLPGSTQEHKVGSAFNRLLLSTEEGGAQAKDYEARMLTDRVRAVGSAWLGQTTGCAQCHDHKFDPITQRDFYAMGAFFADITEGVLGAREPGMLVLDDAQKKKSDEIDARMTSLKKEFDAPRPELAAAQEKWIAAASEASPEVWKVLKPEKVSAEHGVTLKADKDNIIRATLPKQRGQKIEAHTDAYQLTFKTALKGVTGFKIEALKDKSTGVGLAGNGNFVLSEISAELADKTALQFAHASATFEQGGHPAASTIDGITGEKGNGWAVLGGTAADQALVMEVFEEFTEEGESTVSFKLKFGWGENHAISNLRVSVTTSAKPVRAPAVTAPQKEIADILKIDAAKRTDAQRKKLEQQFKQIAPELTDLRAKIQSAEKERKDFDAAAPKCLVSIHNSKPRTVRILPRGNFMDETGEVIKAELPHYLPRPKIEGRALTRLDLAQWLVSKENPLTARVYANRIWKHFFGMGLSKVLDDLGAQGEPPVNPALLDWLACEFMDSGWDMKHLTRAIVTSRTYRQASLASNELATRDPYNREVARQSRFRLDAELVRDNALAVSGLLVKKIGGPSVKPYQPAGYWENLNFPAREWEADKGENVWRRGLYTWWQRSFLQPSMLAFDAPPREESCAERTRSNIPQQALVLLNDPTYVEAARAFAARILKEGGADVDARLTWAWREALSRAPREDELATLRALVEKHSAEYGADQKSAEALVKTGTAAAPAGVKPSELAAWTNAARVILNLHETITRN